MEPLRRKLFLLKPGDSRHLLTGKNRGALKIQSSGNGVTLSLTTDCLGEGDYFLYLFMSGGKDVYAGSVRDNALNTVLADVRLESIIGAAVVHRAEGSHTFCLRSTGPDWPQLIGRFRAARSAIPHADTVSNAFHAVSNTPSAEARSTDANDINTPYIEIPNIEIPDTPYEETVLSAQDIQKELTEVVENQNALGEKTEAGFEESGCDDCPQAQRESKVNPFPSVFPNSEWTKISYPGPTGWWHYISGSIYKGGALVAKALGVPGEYGMAPPVWLEGFGTYLRCFTGEARGYWLMFQDAETGEVLDMGLSQRGG